MAECRTSGAECRTSGAESPDAEVRVEDDRAVSQPTGIDEVDKFVHCSEVQVEGNSVLTIPSSKKRKGIQERQGWTCNESWKELKSKITGEVEIVFESCSGYDKKQGKHLVENIYRHIVDYIPNINWPTDTDWGSFQVLMVNRKRAYLDTRRREIRCKEVIPDNPHIELYDFWGLDSSAGIRCAAAYRYVLHIGQEYKRKCSVTFEDLTVSAADLISEKEKGGKWAFLVHKYGKTYFLKPEVDEDDGLIVAVPMSNNISDEDIYIWQKVSTIYNISVDIVKRQTSQVSKEN